MQLLIKSICSFMYMKNGKCCVIKHYKVCVCMRIVIGENNGFETIEDQYHFSETEEIVIGEMSLN